MSNHNCGNRAVIWFFPSARRVRFTPRPPEGHCRVWLLCVQAAQKGTNCPFLNTNKTLPKSTTKQTLQGLIFVQFWKVCPIPLLPSHIPKAASLAGFHLKNIPFPKSPPTCKGGGHEGRAHTSLALVFYVELGSNDGDLPPESFPWNDGRTTRSKDVSLESCWQIYWPPGQTRLPFPFGIKNCYALSLLIKLLASCCVVMCPHRVSSVTLPYPAPSSPKLGQTSALGHPSPALS